MPKKKKLKLDELKVNSFVTHPEEPRKIRGGTGNYLQEIGRDARGQRDVYTIGDYSCNIDGGCDTSRCAEGTVNTYCGTCVTCGYCPTYCSECYTSKVC